jgi:hypothetical protein
MLRDIARAARAWLLSLVARPSLSIFSPSVPLSEASTQFSQHRQCRAKNFLAA